MISRGLPRHTQLLWMITLVACTDSAIAADSSLPSIGTFWIEGGSALLLLLSGVAIWFVARIQRKRIRELKREAEKLRDADFGEPVQVRPGELGELAAVFNDMRDKLRETTISRDYLDSILSRKSG